MELIQSTILDPVSLVRAFYGLCTIAIASARLLPFLRDRFLVYGARAQPRSGQAPQNPMLRGRNLTPGLEFLDHVARLDVPHSWFTHFYLMSITASISWLLMVYIWRPSSSWSAPDLSARRSPQSRESAMLCLILMLLHGSRRLYECLAVMRPSNSPMWIGHYVFGLTFYLATNVAVWIESVDCKEMERPLILKSLAPPWPINVQVGILTFVLASTMQHLAHRNLASLKKYTLPRGPLFSKLIAPHYTFECMIYISLAMVGAPSGQLLNQTLGCTTILTVVNLGITAEGTKTWMLQKFRKQETEISRRYCLMPGIW